MSRWKGRWLMAVALIHSGYALFVFNGLLAELAVQGVFDSVGEDPMRGAVAWFGLFGLLLLVTGQAIDHLERSGAWGSSRPMGLSLLAMTILGIVLMPASGFWLLLPPAVAMMRAMPRNWDTDRA